MTRPLVLALVAPALLAGTVAQSDRKIIRERRLAYTSAIEARQPDRMRDFIAPEVVQVSSSGAVLSTREVVVESYRKTEFSNPAFVLYERIPETIAISDNRRFAVERGRWRGRFRQPDGKITGNSGLYQAGWIKRDGVWLIRNEHYVRLRCADETDCPK